MESVNEIKAALSVRSRTATLEELRNEGRRRVRLVRAEHIAAMIAEAVHAAIDDSGLVAAGEVEKLVEKSRQEFKAVLQQRETELQRAHDNEQLLAQRDQEIGELKRRLAELSAAPKPPAPAAAAPATSPELVLSLVQEMATLKANLMHQQAQPNGAAPAVAAAPDFAAAIEKLSGSLNDRLEKLGKKMGVSAAVDGDAPVDFTGLFKDTGRALESNIEDIEVKQKAGGGIAANLARLKKLKGGT